MAYLLMKSSHREKSTKIFFWLICFSLIWISTLGLADLIYDLDIAIFAINIAVFSFSMVTWLLLAFALEYGVTSKVFMRFRSTFYLLGIIYNLFYLFIAFNQNIVNQIDVGQYGASITKSSLFYTIHILQANSFAIIAIAILNYKKKKLDQDQKKQIQIMTLGLVIAGVGNILSGVVTTYIPNLAWLNLIGTFSMTVFIVFISYAVIKHKLFDIRSVVARSLAYTMSIALLAMLYSVFVYGLGGTIFDLSNISLSQRILFVTLALLVATSYHTIISFFNQITNKIFYRDAYQTQEVLDKVSGIIVGNVDPKKVQKGALTALSDAIKPTYMTFLLLDSNGELRQGDIVGQHWQMHDTQLLARSLKYVGTEIVIYDSSKESGNKLFGVLRVEDISLVSPMFTKEEIIGYLVLGPKKSGNIYNSQDVGLLNIASNELAVALQNAQRFEEIQAFNITLQEKVTEATRELKKTNRKLIALDEAKDEFISMASHQLRTPLTSIKGYISMMMEGDLGKLTAQQENALKEAFGSSQRMVYLIADFLNVSRIKTGKFVIEPKEVDLPQLVGEEITQLREMAASRDITLQYQQPGVFPKVMLDDNKIRQVMMNMVDNAIYYTPAGGVVQIQLYIDSDSVVFKVKDSGIGVPKREQHKLFTKFFRANNAKKARPDGTGLGLFMAQKIIVEQGGSIIFESTEGKGSTFGFRFPLSKIKA